MKHGPNVGSANRPRSVGQPRTDTASMGYGNTVMGLAAVIGVGTLYVLLHEKKRKRKKLEKQLQDQPISKELLLKILHRARSACRRATRCSAAAAAPGVASCQYSMRRAACLVGARGGAVGCSGGRGASGAAAAVGRASHRGTR